MPEGAPSYSEMTTRAFLDFIAEIRGYRGGEIAKRMDAAVKKTRLAPVLDQTIETLSKGYKRRVGLAQAILHDPPVLVMDEPTDGLDPNQKHHVRELIKTMAAEKAIIISTHILEEVEAVCTRAVVINRGTIVADGTAEDPLHRIRYHGAVSIRVPTERSDAAIRLLQAPKYVAVVETLGNANGHIHIRALPREGALETADVAAMLRAQPTAATSPPSNSEATGARFGSVSPPPAPMRRKPNSKTFRPAPPAGSSKCLKPNSTPSS